VRAEASTLSTRWSQTSLSFPTVAPAIVSRDLCPRCVLLAQVTWVNKFFHPHLANNQQVSLFPTILGDFITKANIVRRIQIGAISLGQPNRSLTGKDLWGGHAYRRGIVHYFTLSGVQVNSIQSLLRHAPTSKGIVKYMGTAKLHSDSTLAEEAARTSALQDQQEPPEISNLNTTTQCHPLKHLAVFEQQGSVATRNNTSTNYSRLRSTR
jgi:hypothetical protein